MHVHRRKLQHRHIGQKPARRANTFRPLLETLEDRTLLSTAANVPPIAQNDTATTNEDSTLTIDVLANDADTDFRAALHHAGTTVITSNVSNNPDHFLFSVGGTNIFPFLNVDDGQGTFQLVEGFQSLSGVTPSNLIFTLDDLEVLNVERTAGTATIFYGDTDGSPAVFELFHGTQLIARGDNLLLQTIIDTDETSPSFGQSTGTGTVTLNGVVGGAFHQDVLALTGGTGILQFETDAFTAIASGDPAIFETSGRITLDAVPAATLSVTAVDTTNSNGTVVINSDGTITYTPNLNFHGTDTFTYTIADRLGAGANATVAVTVNPVNDAPSAVDDSATTNEDTPVNVNVLANDSDVEGDSFSVVAISNPANGSATIQADNTILYEPDPDFHGNDSYTYTVQDSNGASSAATVSLIVNSVNDAPIAADDSAITNESTDVLIDVLANDSDVEGDTLSITATGSAAGAAVAIEDGKIRYTPAASFIGSDSFTYTISDGNGENASATVSLTVNGVPTALNDSYVTEKSAILSITAAGVLANDSDPDPVDTLTLAAVNGAGSNIGSQITLPSGALLTVNANGSFDYDPNGQFAGLTFGQQATDSFTYTASDGRGGTDQATVNITVANSLIERPDLVLTSSDISFSSANPGPGDMVTITAVIRNAGFSDADAFDVEFRDFGTSIGMATVSGLAAGASTTVSLNASFPEAGFRLISVVADSGHVVSETKEGNNEAGLALQIGSPPASSALINVDANSVSVEAGQPVAVTGTGFYDFDSVEGTQDSPVQGGAVTVEVYDGSTLLSTFTGSQTNVNGDLSQLIVAPLTVGTYTLRVTVTDFTLTNSEDSTLTVNEPVPETSPPPFVPPAPNDPPPPQTVGDSGSGGAGGSGAVNDFVTTIENTAVNVDVLANDGDGLSVVAVGIPGNGSTTKQADDTITYNPDPDFRGNDSFTYTVEDSGGTSSTATVNVLVTEEGGGIEIAGDPSFGSGAASVNNDVPNNVFVYAEHVFFSDANADLGEEIFVFAYINFSGGNDPVGSFTVELNDIFPVAGEFQTYNMGSTTVNFPAGESDGPQAVVIPYINTAVGAHIMQIDTSPPSVKNVTTLDDDATRLLQVGPTSPALDLQKTVLLLTDGDNNGVVSPGDTLKYAIVATNNGATAATGAVVNDDYDESLADAPTTISGGGTASGGVINWNLGNLAANSSVTLTYELQVSSSIAEEAILGNVALLSTDDSAAIFDTSRVLIHTNIAPVAGDDAVTTAEDNAITIDVLGNDADADGDALMVTAVSDPANGTAAINSDGTITYTPDPDFNGIDTIIYTIDDGNGGSNTATVTVTANAVSDNPVAAGDTAITDEDNLVTINVLGNDSDVDGDTLMVATVSDPANGTAVINPDGTITYTPDSNFNGTDTFTYEIDDGNGATATATVAVTVNSVNDNPVAAADTAVTDEDNSVTINVLGNDADVDGDVLSVAAVSDPVNGSAAINPDGAITYTPDPDFNGTDAITYTIADGNGGSDTATVTVTVNSRPDVDFSGRVFDDRNNDGRFNGDDAGVAGITVQLFDETNLTTPLATLLTGADGAYLFDLDLQEGAYRIVADQPAHLLDGKENAGDFGGTVDNAQDSNVIGNIVVPGDAGDVLAGTYNFANIRSSRIQGLVWEDLNNDGEVNFGERAIEGVAVRLTGTDDHGVAVDQIMQTDSNGIYEFVNLRPSDANGYALTETQPAGYLDGIDSLGAIGGVLNGTTAVDDVFSQIGMTQPGSDAMNYNFGERPEAGGEVQSGVTATIGFWQNKNGQELIRSLNGGPDSTQLADWLAATFPNMYGVHAGSNNLTRMTNAEVAEFYTTLFKRNNKTALAGPPKVDAQVMAVALAAYVTNSNLAGTTAESYGFIVSETGVGTSVINVGNNGQAFDVADNALLTVFDLLLATNTKTTDGVLYDLDKDNNIDSFEEMLRTMANEVYTLINEQGDI